MNNKEIEKPIKSDFQEIGELFRLPGDVRKVTLIKDGTLATSYRIDYDTKKSYLFQKMKVAKDDLVKTMENVENFAKFLSKKNYSMVYFYHTNSKDNIVEYKDESWRAREFYKEYSYRKIDDLNIIKELGASLGTFQYITRNYNLSSLNEVYPNIHNVSHNIADSDNNYVKSVSEQALVVEKAAKEGLIPQRLVHNDAVIKTFVVGKKKRLRFYINVDLIQSGIGLYDFASVALIYCATTTFNESEEPKFDLDKYAAFLEGYISIFGGFLTKTEKQLLPDSLLAIAVENIALNKNKEIKREWYQSLALSIQLETPKIRELTEKIIANTKKVKVDLNSSPIERDYPVSGAKTYKAGEYMQLSIPHNVKVKKGAVYSFLKRAFDIFASLLAIIILLPFLIIVGLIVKITSKGPIIYVSKRVGKNGRIFNFYKFRSMYKDAEQRLNELLDQNEVEGGITFKIKNDPRITPFGKFIRKTSIDELPQLFNVLKGDISIIGPRAALPREVVLYPDEALDRLVVPQGLSGEWQANGRSDTTFDNMIKMDLDYIENKRGLRHDLYLILKTVVVVIKGNGAE